MSFFSRPLSDPEPKKIQIGILKLICSTSREFITMSRKIRGKFHCNLDTIIAQNFIQKQLND